MVERIITVLAEVFSFQSEDHITEVATQIRNLLYSGEADE